jgi:hypothetical protein
MRTFRDFLKEEFKNKKFEKEFRKDVEKARISLEIYAPRNWPQHGDSCERAKRKSQKEEVV